MHSPLRSPLERIERAGRILTAAALGLLLAATVGGLVFPSPAPDLTNPNFRPLAHASAAERLAIPSLNIDAPVIPIDLSPGSILNPPDDPSVLGWWRASAQPGAVNGQTIITGHTVHTGGGEMDHLGAISDGAIIQITTPDGVLWYRETQLLILTKDEVIKRNHEIFTQNHKPNRLVLITCTGWTGHDYTGNVVVYADPLGVPVSPSPH